MGYKQPVPLFFYVYARLALGADPSSMHRKKPVHALQLLLAATVRLVLPKRANILRSEYPFYQALS